MCLSILETLNTKLKMFMFLKIKYIDHNSTSHQYIRNQATLKGQQATLAIEYM